MDFLECRASGLNGVSGLIVAALLESDPLARAGRVRDKPERQAIATVFLRAPTPRASSIPGPRRTRPSPPRERRQRKRWGCSGRIPPFRRNPPVLPRRSHPPTPVDVGTMVNCSIRSSQAPSSAHSPTPLERGIMLISAGALPSLRSPDPLQGQPFARCDLIEARWRLDPPARIAIGGSNRSRARPCGLLAAPNRTLSPLPSYLRFRRDSSGPREAFAFAYAGRARDT